MGNANTIVRCYTTLVLATSILTLLFDIQSYLNPAIDTSQYVIHAPNDWLLVLLQHSKYVYRQVLLILFL